MKQMLIPLAVALMLTAGAGLFLYPAVSDWLSAKNHSTAIQRYNETISNTGEEAIAAQKAAAEQYNDMLTGGSIEDPFIPGSGAVVSDEYTTTLNLGGTMGRLTVPRVDIDLPIYHGTGEDALKKGVGHLDATALPIGGAGNHSVLTGHRGLPSAKLFTDLDQVEEGDIFYLSILDETLAYRVDQIKVIDPSDTSDLRPVAGEDYVTLLTCTPYAVNSHRLLVRGTRIDGDLPEEQEALPPQGAGTYPAIAIIRIMVVEGIVLLAVVLAYLAKRRRR